MKTKKLSIILSVLLVICIAIGCHSQQKPDIRPHPVNLSADSFYQKAVAILQSSYDVDSTRKCISLLDRALSIDSLNPDYYGTKAKLLAEMGELDSALCIQLLAMEKKAITGEYMFQLGLFQAARDMNAEAQPLYERYRCYSQTFSGQTPGNRDDPQTEATLTGEANQKDSDRE